MQKYFVVRLDFSDRYLYFDKETQTYGFGSIQNALILDDSTFKVSPEAISMFNLQKQYIHITDDENFYK